MITINQGTQTTIATDTVGTTEYGVVKIDVGPTGVSNLIGSVYPLPVTLQTQIAGEDLTNNKLTVEQRFSRYTSFGTSNGTVKSSSGFLHTLSVTNPMMFGAAGTISLWDGTAASGSVLGTVTVPAGTIGQPFTLTFDETFSNGLCLSFGGTSLPYLNISYR